MPYRMIYQVFKVLAMAMVMVFVFDIVFYLYRAYSLNQRMESMCVSLQKVVSENNYLPEGQYNMFMMLFDDMADSFNSGYVTNDDGTVTKVDESSLDTTQQKINKFIVRQEDGHAVRLNYGQAPEGGTPTITDVTVGSDLSKPLDYGDVAYIQAKVEVKQPVWGFLNAGGGYNYSGHHGTGADQLQNSNTSTAIDEKTTEFTYTYLVPCLKYQSVTN